VDDYARMFQGAQDGLKRAGSRILLGDRQPLDGMGPDHVWPPGWKKRVGFLQMNTAVLLGGN
jgi:hypothetical protein